MDSKLSKATDLTDNQRDARKLGEWSVKAISDESLIQDTGVKALAIKSKVVKQGDFIKLFNDNGILKAQ